MARLITLSMLTSSPVSTVGSIMKRIHVPCSGCPGYFDMSPGFRRSCPASVNGALGSKSSPSKNPARPWWKNCSYTLPAIKVMTSKRTEIPLVADAPIPCVPVVVPFFDWSKLEPDMMFPRKKTIPLSWSSSWKSMGMPRPLSLTSTSPLFQKKISTLSA